MAYNENSKALIKVEFESGLMTKTAICQKWSMSPNTLKKFGKKGNWRFGANDTKVTDTITKKAEERLTEKYTQELEDFTVDHIKAMDEVGDLTKKSLERLRDSVEEEDKDGNSNQMTKAEAETIFSQQKVLKISSETLSIIYADKRKALGLDKPKQEESGKTDLEERIKASMERDGFKY